MESTCHLYNKGKCIRCGGRCDENNWTRVFHEDASQTKRLVKLAWAKNCRNMLLEVCVKCGYELKENGFWVEIYEYGQSHEFNRVT